jgi:hypothetical protein
MKNLFILLCVLLNWSLPAYEVKVRIVDETGAPVVGANASILFVNYDGSDVRNGHARSGGEFSAIGRCNDSVMIRASMDRHYQAQIEDLSKDKDHDLEVVLPRILNPVPLYALRNVSVKFPVQAEWIGFDFEVADWVAPHGKGKTNDILFRFHNEFKGWDDRIKSPDDMERALAVSREGCVVKKIEWSMDVFKTSFGKWDSFLEISFPGKKEGMVEVARFLSYSRLKVPHSAPIDGYLSAWRYEGKSYSAKVYRKDVGYFLRSRVRLDQDGNILSANYAKIIGDFLVASKGGQVTFSYFFNPVPNDRNLEFDTNRNLFPRDKLGANVYDP